MLPEESSDWVWSTWRSVAPDENRPSQHHATVAVSPSGDRCVAWDEMGGEGRAWARTFDASGVPHQGPRPIIECAEDGPCRPDVLAVNDEFWVAASNEEGIWLARFDHLGQWAMTPKRIAAPSEGEVLEAPAMAIAEGGGVAVVWLHRTLDSEVREGGYSLRFVTLEGEVNGDAVAVGSSPGGVAVPDVTSLPEGRVAVIWLEVEKEGAARIWVTPWDVTGKAGVPSLLDEGALLKEPRPMIASDDEGVLAAVWRRTEVEDTYTGALRFGRADGTWGETQTLRPEGEFDKPVVEVLDGVAMVAWDGRSWEEGSQTRRVCIQPWSTEDEAPLSNPEPAGLAESPEERPGLSMRSLGGGEVDVALVWREIHWGARVPNRVRLRGGVWTPCGASASRVGGGRVVEVMIRGRRSGACLFRFGFTHQESDTQDNQYETCADTGQPDDRDEQQQHL